MVNEGGESKSEMLLKLSESMRKMSERKSEKQKRDKGVIKYTNRLQ